MAGLNSKGETETSGVVEDLWTGGEAVKIGTPEVGIIEITAVGMIEAIEATIGIGATKGETIGDTTKKMIEAKGKSTQGIGRNGNGNSLLE